MRERPAASGRATRPNAGRAIALHPDRVGRRCRDGQPDVADLADDDRPLAGWRGVIGDDERTARPVDAERTDRRLRTRSGR